MALVSGDIPASSFVCIHSLPQTLAVASDSVQWNNNEVGWGFEEQVLFVSLSGRELSVPELLGAGTMSGALEGVRF